MSADITGYEPTVIVDGDWVQGHVLGVVTYTEVLTLRERRQVFKFWCRRWSGPRPLAVDGHAYRRRTRRRKP